MTTNVLLINRQLVFAVTIKQALEQTRLFSVHPFTSADAALDYLRSHPHDVALVDFTLPDYNGPQLVRRLRAVQPGIAVIVSPAQPNARALMQELDLQGVVDAPFSARTIIPVIEHAVELVEQPLSARTRSLIDDSAPDDSATDMLPDRSHDVADMLPLRGGFDDEEGSGTPLQTRVFDTDDDDEDVGFMPPSHGGDTRVLDDSGLDDEPLPWERPVSAPTPVDFSSLSSILTDEAPSEMFEPPPGAEDTPSVPTIDSDAVRQFLATRSEGEDDTFGSVLGAIDPTAEMPSDAVRRAGSFDDLVNSMRADRQHTPLPDRHQQFMEFILTGGMDNLLTELEKAKTGPLDDDSEPAPDEPAPPDTFTTLAAEEPPLPTLEESGTIGDLMIGVSDTSFRNVLALMRGEQVVAGESAGFEADFEEFFGQAAAEPESDEADSEPAQPNADADIDAFFAGMAEPAPAPPAPAAPPRRDRPGPGSIPARMILETAQDESTPADSFSLDTLIDSIERQLEDHLPDVKPLPSWGEAVKLPRRPAPPPAAERFVEEPDFLPETFAEPETPHTTAPLPTWEDMPDEAFETTLASQAQREQIEQGQEAQETEAFFFDFDELEAEAETEAEAAPAMPAEAGMPTEDGQPVWPDADSDIAAAWQSFVPAAAADDEPYPDEELPAFDDEPFYSDETLVSQSTPTPAAADDDYPDWMEALLPPAQAAEPVYAEDEAASAAELPAYDDVWELAVDQPPAEEMTQFDHEDAESDLPAAALAEPALVTAESGQMVEGDDPYIAQLALSLTQVSLELTAEATLLTRDGEIAAFAGTLAAEDVDALRAAVSDNWEAGEDEARIRFVALDGGGREYMLYSRRTAGGFTLTMVFGGATPLRDIRRQGKRLLESLAAVPDTLPEAPTAAAQSAPADAPAQVTEPAQAATLAPCTYMWLLRDPNITLNEAAARAIRVGLHTQLAELGWHVQTLRAQDEYVYVYAHVPGERAAYLVADELKRRAADILRAQFAAIDPRTVWADSYLVMTPGRDLDADEIAQFIDFERLL